MQAIDQLRHEHEIIGRMLTVLEEQLSRLQRGQTLDAEVLRRAIVFVRGFADHCHHAKEEAALFPLIAGKNQILAYGPVKVLTSEHETGRYFIGEMEESLDGIEAGDPSAIKRCSRALGLYTKMLRKHIEKENGILFPLAESMITADEAALLLERFEAVEAQLGEGVHERYEAIISGLETGAFVT
jgi:hemerythrin-like domain-containing protein